MEEYLGKIKSLKGCIVSQISFLANDGLTLYIKRHRTDRSSFSKIVFEGVLGFHDTGLIGGKIDYVDGGLLGFKYSSYARTNSQNPDEFSEIVFITEDNGSKVELIVAFRNVSIVEE